MVSSSQRIFRVPTPAERGAAIFDAYRYRLTQAELAALLGVSQNTISRWSTGVSEPTLETFIRIESVCGLAQGHILRSAGYVQELGAAEDFIAADHRLDDVRRNLMLSLYLVALHQAGVSPREADLGAVGRPEKLDGI